jgi:hypothetical protein
MHYSRRMTSQLTFSSSEEALVTSQNAQLSCRSVSEIRFAQKRADTHAEHHQHDESCEGHANGFACLKLRLHVSLLRTFHVVLSPSTISSSAVMNRDGMELDFGQVYHSCRVWIQPGPECFIGITACVGWWEVVVGIPRWT